MVTGRMEYSPTEGIIFGMVAICGEIIGERDERAVHKVTCRDGRILEVQNRYLILIALAGLPPHTFGTALFLGRPITNS